VCVCVVLKGFVLGQAEGPGVVIWRSFCGGGVAIAVVAVWRRR